MAVPVIQSLATQDRPLDYHVPRVRSSDMQERDSEEIAIHNEQHNYHQMNHEREHVKVQQHHLHPIIPTPGSQEGPHSDPYHFEMRPVSPGDSDSNSSRSPDSLGGDDRVDKMAMIPSLPVRLTLLQQRVSTWNCACSRNVSYTTFPFSEAGSRHFRNNQTSNTEL